MKTKIGLRDLKACNLNHNILHYGHCFKTIMKKPDYSLLFMGTRVLISEDM